MAKTVEVYGNCVARLHLDKKIWAFICILLTYIKDLMEEVFRLIQAAQRYLTCKMEF